MPILLDMIPVSIKQVAVTHKEIDTKITQSGWVIQYKDRQNLLETLGVAIRESDQIPVPAENMRFVNGKASQVSLNELHRIIGEIPQGRHHLIDTQQIKQENYGRMSHRHTAVLARELHLSHGKAHRSYFKHTNNI